MLERVFILEIPYQALWSDKNRETVFFLSDCAEKVSVTSSSET